VSRDARRVGRRAPRIRRAPPPAARDAYVLSVSSTH
jgi:hypothetical protein